MTGLIIRRLIQIPLILLVILAATSGYQVWVSAATNPGLELKYE